MDLIKTCLTSFAKVVNCDEGSSFFLVWHSNKLSYRLENVVGHHFRSFMKVFVKWFVMKKETLEKTLPFFWA